MSDNPIVAASGAGAGDIAGLLVSFSEAVDRRRPSEIARLFAPGGVFRPGAREMRGPEDIEAFYKERLADPRRVTRHLWNNLRIIPLDEGEVLLDVVLTVYAFEPQVSETELQMRIGDVSGRCVLEDGQWRFAEHLYQRTFATCLPLADAPPKS